METGEPELLIEDLIREILLKLPSKTLVRFKRVSKIWLGMITSTSFTFRHYQIANKQPSAEDNHSFFVVRRPRTHEVQCYISRISVTPGHECTIHENIYLPCLEVEATETDDGDPGPLPFPLVYPMGYGLYCIFERLTQRVALWNPSTREIKMLPPSPHYNFDNRAWYMHVFGNVEYKDGKFSFKIGLLFPDYALTEGIAGYNVRHYTVELYSSSSNSWQRYNHHDIPFYYLTRPHGVNFKGTLHLLSYKFLQDPHIITFDYSTEEFGRIELFPLQEAREHKIHKSLLTLHDDKYLCLFLCWVRELEAGVEYIHNEEEAVDEQENDEYFEDNDQLTELEDLGMEEEEEEEEGAYAYEPEMKEFYWDMWVMHDYGVKESWRKLTTLGPIVCDHGMDALAYLKSLGGVFLKSAVRLNICDCTSSVLKNCHVNSFLELDMHVLPRLESLVSFGGTPDGVRIKKL